MDGIRLLNAQHQREISEMNARHAESVAQIIASFEASTDEEIIDGAAIEKEHEALMKESAERLRIRLMALKAMK